MAEKNFQPKAYADLAAQDDVYLFPAPGTGNADITESITVPADPYTVRIPQAVEGTIPTVTVGGSPRVVRDEAPASGYVQYDRATGDMVFHSSDYGGTDPSITITPYAMHVSPELMRWMQADTKQRYKSGDNISVGTVTATGLTTTAGVSSSSDICRTGTTSVFLTGNQADAASNVTFASDKGGANMGSSGQKVFYSIQAFAYPGSVISKVKINYKFAASGSTISARLDRLTVTNTSSDPSPSSVVSSVSATSTGTNEYGVLEIDVGGHTVDGDYVYMVRIRDDTHTGTISIFNVEFEFTKRNCA